ncbi:hypothetical protein [Hwanghaeella grinnelliae]|uniref:hypothetical protein n=1 Tax=Hwanghaeella grinnelliae TaxID=2500179 RepID=UPI001F02A6E6|nr:hypothetical protein [Hwanghaeella grinnelliae]
MPNSAAAEATGKAGGKEAALVKDSLHLLGMEILPLRMPALKRARLVKNNQLQTMVELFHDDTAGSGQVLTEELPGFFPQGGDDFKADLILLKKFDDVPSFDVYSTRITLRELNIPIDDHEALRLSEAKREELTERMKTFTHPLIGHVYGAEAQSVDDLQGILGMFKDPDPKTALANLRKMADSLGIELMDIPKFLEDYGDIFLSLAFFRDILDKTVPTIHQYLEWMAELRESFVVKQDRAQDNMLAKIEADLTDITGSITGRFESFDRKTNDFWTDINAERFHEVRELITAHHRTVGGVLCGLTLKMEHWKKKFRNSGAGGPQQRLEFTRSEVLPGLDWIKDLERRGSQINK